MITKTIMIALIVLCFIGAASTAQALQPTSEGKKIFENLRDRAEVKPGVIRLKIDSDSRANAWMKANGDLVLNSGEIVLMCNRNSDCIAASIAHEIGHWVLGHLKYPDLSNAESRQEEKEADIYSIGLMVKAGYDCRAAAQYFQKIQDAGAGSDGQGTHPATGDRIRYLTAECNKYQK